MRTGTPLVSPLVVDGAETARCRPLRPGVTRPVPASSSPGGFEARTFLRCAPSRNQEHARPDPAELGRAGGAGISRSTHRLLVATWCSPGHPPATMTSASVAPCTVAIACLPRPYNDLDGTIASVIDAIETFFLQRLESFSGFGYTLPRFACGTNGLPAVSLDKDPVRIPSTLAAEQPSS